jgi:hypothetical protein
MNQAHEPRDTIDPTTREGLQAMDAAHVSLQHQLQTGEMTQDAYEDAWTDLIATVPPAVPKASMEKRHDAADDAWEKTSGASDL